MDVPGSTSRSEQPSTTAIACAIASITSLFRPSEKFGTHSTILGMVNKNNFTTDCDGNGKLKKATSNDSQFLAGVAHTDRDRLGENQFEINGG